jgi:hypothetical protein
LNKTTLREWLNDEVVKVVLEHKDSRLNIPDIHAKIEVDVISDFSGTFIVTLRIAAVKIRKCVLEVVPSVLQQIYAVCVLLNVCFIYLFFSILLTWVKASGIVTVLGRAERFVNINVDSE